MTKAEIINEISRTTGINSAKASSIVESFFASIKENLENGEKVYIRGFGSFIHKKRAKKLARDINKNISVMVEEHYIPFFKPSVEFKQLIRDSNKIAGKNKNKKIVQEPASV
jgi:DNA-binding protein HU-beta